MGAIYAALSVFIATTNSYSTPCCLFLALFKLNLCERNSNLSESRQSNGTGELIEGTNVVFVCRSSWTLWTNSRNRRVKLISRLLQVTEFAFSSLDTRHTLGVSDRATWATERKVAPERRLLRAHWAC